MGTLVRADAERLLMGWGVGAARSAMRWTGGAVSGRPQGHDPSRLWEPWREGSRGVSDCGWHSLGALRC